MFVVRSQEAVVQYEQYEQEVRDLQELIEEAHRVIQDRPINTNNIQELQAQILHHEVRCNHSFAYIVLLLSRVDYIECLVYILKYFIIDACVD